MECNHWWDMNFLGMCSNANGTKARETTTREGGVPPLRRNRVYQNTVGSY